VCEPEEEVADAKPRRQQYALPSEYGPDSAPGNGEPAADQAVRTLPRDAPGPAPTRPTSRRERRESLDARRRARPRSAAAKWVLRGVTAALAVVLLVAGWSYSEGGQSEDRAPLAGGRPHAIRSQSTSGAVPVDPRLDAAATEPLHFPPPMARVPTPAPSVEPNEGIWMPAGRLVGGLPAQYVAFVRPDAVHTSFYVALMWLDTKLLRATYVPGLLEPGAGPNPWGSQVPEDQRGTLVAAFNSGLGMDSARGGVYFAGREVRGLVDGAASLVIRSDGSTTVGTWNRDVTMGPEVASVRQNLELLVDDGRLNPELRDPDTDAFGDTVGNHVYVWRSGVGVDANGALIYAGGNTLSLRSLAKTLQAAGAVRAMALDVGTDGVSAYTYVNRNDDPAAQVIGKRLGRDMARDGDRYLEPGERDFVAFFADPTS
jgi:Phosphodiester glycosidase